MRNCLEVLSPGLSFNTLSCEQKTFKCLGRPYGDSDIVPWGTGKDCIQSQVTIGHTRWCHRQLNNLCKQNG